MRPTGRWTGAQLQAYQKARLARDSSSCDIELEQGSARPCLVAYTVALPASHSGLNHLLAQLLDLLSEHLSIAIIDEGR
jgi:hypothetical protein